MNTNHPSAVPETRAGYWWRVLRPLFWWLMFVLALFGYRQNEIMMDRMRINFMVTMQGNDVTSGVIARLDGQPLSRGQKFSLGKHTLTISYPKADLFTTDFHGRYGEPQNFGPIILQRSTGRLLVAANPLARQITIVGPEASLTLYDSAGTNISVPTDTYEIQAQYPRWSQTQNVTVSPNITVPSTFAPQFGDIRLTCNEVGASFELRDAANQIVEAGDFPKTLAELVAGSYRLTATHHQHVIRSQLIVQSGVTNDVPVTFKYGSVTLNSTPSGAGVRDESGNYLGMTPLCLSELNPGTLRLIIQLSGYESASASLEIAAGQTNSFNTNLVSLNYTRVINDARQYSAMTNYDLALKEIDQALEARPGDSVAIALQHEVSIKRHFLRAANYGAQRNYKAAIVEYNAILAMQADNEQAKQLLADSQKSLPEQLERERQARLARPREDFEKECSHRLDANLFEAHEFKVAKKAKDVASAIYNDLRTKAPFFDITGYDAGVEDNAIIFASQPTSMGKRECIVVVGQTTDTETLVLFKVVERKTKHNVSMPGMLAFRDDISLVAMHPSQIPNMDDSLKAWVAEGVKMVSERLQRAIGPD